MESTTFVPPKGLPSLTSMLEFASLSSRPPPLSPSTHGSMSGDQFSATVSSRVPVELTIPPTLTACDRMSVPRSPLCVEDRTYLSSMLHAPGSLNLNFTFPPKVSAPKFASPKLDSPKFAAPKLIAPKVGPPRFAVPKFPPPRLSPPLFPYSAESTQYDYQLPAPLLTFPRVPPSRPSPSPPPRPPPAPPLKPQGTLQYARSPVNFPASSPRQNRDSFVPRRASVPSIAPSPIATPELSFSESRSSSVSRGEDSSYCPSLPNYARSGSLNLDQHNFDTAAMSPEEFMSSGVPVATDKKHFDVGAESEMSSDSGIEYPPVLVSKSRYRIPTGPNDRKGQGRPFSESTFTHLHVASGVEDIFASMMGVPVLMRHMFVEFNTRVPEGSMMLPESNSPIGETAECPLLVDSERVAESLRLLTGADDFYFVQIVRFSLRLNRHLSPHVRLLPAVKFVCVPPPSDDRELTCTYMKQMIAHPRYKANMKLFVVPGKLETTEWHYVSDYMMAQEATQMRSGELVSPANLRIFKPTVYMMEEINLRRQRRIRAGPSKLRGQESDAPVRAKRSRSESDKSVMSQDAEDRRPQRKHVCTETRAAKHILPKGEVDASLQPVRPFRV